MEKQSSQDKSSFLDSIDSAFETSITGEPLESPFCTDALLTPEQKEVQKNLVPPPGGSLLSQDAQIINSSKEMNSEEVIEKIKNFKLDPSVFDGCKRGEVMLNETEMRELNKLLSCWTSGVSVVVASTLKRSRTNRALDAEPTLTRAQKRASVLQKNIAPSSAGKRTRSAGSFPDEFDDRPAREKRSPQAKSARKRAREEKVAAFSFPEKRKSTKAGIGGMSTKHHQACSEILRRIKKHQCAYYFRNPVDGVNVPGYYEMIKTPMCLSTIEDKFLNNLYNTADDFSADMRLIVSNALAFHTGDNNEIKNKALDFQKMFDNLLAAQEATLRNPKEMHEELMRLREQMAQQEAESKSSPRADKKPAKALSAKEIEQLSERLNYLQPEQIQHVLDLVSSEFDYQEQGGEVELDISKLSTSKVREVWRYVNRTLGKKIKKNRKDESSSAESDDEGSQAYTTISK